ncbi:MAG: MFS transporter [Steroidobacteraceae bacterium]
MSPAQPKWWQQRRWQIAVLLMLVTAVGSIDRQAMSVTAATLKSGFALSNTDYGLLGSGFLMAYALGQLLSGIVVDRVGTRRALAWAVILWSFAAIGHAASAGFAGLLLARVLLGVTEGANFPAAFKAIAEWFPRAERSMATGLVVAGTGLGLILAPPLAGTLTHYFGWQAAFLVPGVAGLLWVGVWWRRYHLPENHPQISSAERELALRDRVSVAAGTGGLAQQIAMLGHYFRFRQTWGLVLSRFIGDGAFYFFAFWLPLYLQSERGFTLLNVAFAAALPFVCADLGSLSGGWLGQKLIRRGVSVDRSRKSLIWAGCLTTLCAWPVATVSSAPVALLLAAVAIFGIQVKTSSLFPLAADIYPAEHVAKIWGLSGAAGAFGAALFQSVFGVLIDKTGYNVVFVLSSLICIAQALMISLFIRRVEPLELSPAAADKAKAH